MSARHDPSSLLGNDARGAAVRIAVLEVTAFRTPGIFARFGLSPELAA